jgi:hypothetical protein
MGHESSFNLFAFTLTTFLFAFIVWLGLFAVLGVIAAGVAPEGRRRTFFWLTFLILGPLGVGFAAVASPRPSEPLEGTRAHYCLQCAARNLVNDADTEFTCWQCDEEHEIDPHAA